MICFLFVEPWNGLFIYCCIISNTIRLSLTKMVSLMLWLACNSQEMPLVLELKAQRKHVPPHMVESSFKQEEFWLCISINRVKWQVVFLHLIQVSLVSSVLPLKVFKESGGFFCLFVFLVAVGWWVSGPWTYCVCTKLDLESSTSCLPVAKIWFFFF